MPGKPIGEDEQRVQGGLVIVNGREMTRCCEVVQNELGTLDLKREDTRDPARQQWGET